MEHIIQQLLEHHLDLGDHGSRGKGKAKENTTEYESTDFTIKHHIGDEMNYAAKEKEHIIENHESLDFTIKHYLGDEMNYAEKDFTERVMACRLEVGSAAERGAPTKSEADFDKATRDEYGAMRDQILVQLKNGEEEGIEISEEDVMYAYCEELLDDIENDEGMFIHQRAIQLIINHMIDVEGSIQVTRQRAQREKQVLKLTGRDQGRRSRRVGLDDEELREALEGMRRIRIEVLSAPCRAL